MWKLRRLLTMLGIGAAAAIAAVVMPLSVAHAADTDSGSSVAPGYGGGPYESCDGAVCLVMGDLNLNDWTYRGVRPLVTDWRGDQLYHVQYGGADGPIAGSYNISVDDFWSTVFSSSEYHFGDFVPNADAPTDLDLGWYADLSGATVSKLDFFNGAFTNTLINNVGPHDASYWVFSTPDYTNVMVTAGGVSADYIQIGDADPQFLWNSLLHPGLQEAQVPDYLIPNDPFTGVDFDPSQYLADALANWF